MIAFVQAIEREREKITAAVIKCRCTVINAVEQIDNSSAVTLDIERRI